MAQPRFPYQMRAAGTSGEENAPRPFRFINPHHLFHVVWISQWLEERPEVSEKATKLNAYLTYFAGGKGCSWPSFGLLAEKLHRSRRHVMRERHAHLAPSSRRIAPTSTDIAKQADISAETTVHPMLDPPISS